MSRIYGTCNSTIRFSKFISNKKKYEKSLMGLEILERNLICYLLFGPVLVPQLVNWDPFETSSEASKTILFTGILFIFQGIPAFFFFWKQINCFQIMCFRKCGDPWTPANSFYQVHLECTCVPKNRLKFKVSFHFWIDFFFGNVIFGFFWYSFEFFLDIHYLI